MKKVNVVNLKVFGLKEQIFAETLVIPEMCNSSNESVQCNCHSRKLSTFARVTICKFLNFETKSIELLI